MKFILKKIIYGYLICFLPTLVYAPPYKILQRFFPCCCKEDDSPPRTPADTELLQRFAVVGVIQHQTIASTQRSNLKTKRSDDDVSSQGNSQQTLPVPPPSIIEFQNKTTATKQESASDSDNEWVVVSRSTFNQHDA